MRHAALCKYGIISDMFVQDIPRGLTSITYDKSTRNCWFDTRWRFIIAHQNMAPACTTRLAFPVISLSETGSINTCSFRLRVCSSNSCQTLFIHLLLDTLEKIIYQIYQKICPFCKYSVRKIYKNYSQRGQIFCLIWQVIFSVHATSINGV